jgi:ABC-2 type transport system ATP-binding protein
VHPIQARDLSVVYRTTVFGRPTVGLDGLGFSVKEGEVYGFIGANGAGKTTTIKALLGLIRPSRGESFLLGTSSRDPASRREVGFIPEAPYFYEYLTARESLQFYGRLSGMDVASIPSRAGEVLERVGLSFAADRRLRT